MFGGRSLEFIFLFEVYGKATESIKPATQKIVPLSFYVEHLRVKKLADPSIVTVSYGISNIQIASPVEGSVKSAQCPGCESVDAKIQMCSARS